MIALTLLEVMDKEPSIASMWISTAVLGVGGFFVCRRWWWAVLLILPIVALGTWGSSGEINDLLVGPAILREAGPSYPIHAYGSAAISALLPLLGCLARLIERRGRIGPAGARW